MQAISEDSSQQTEENADEVIAALRLCNDDTHKPDLASRGNMLERRLRARPSIIYLQNNNILKGRGSAKLQTSQARLQLSQRKDKLNNLFASRSNKVELVNRGIFASHDQRSKKREARKKMSLRLDGFLKNRSSLSHLAKQKIISDIGVIKPVDGPGAGKIQIEPAVVEDLKEHKFVSVACGWSHTLALTADGNLNTFGSGANGRLGIGDTVPHATPQQVDWLKGCVSAIACGDNHSAAVASGKLYTWGMGGWGRLGLGNQEDALEPQEVKSIGGEVKSVSCGSYHTVALTAKGEVYACGWNKNGRVGCGKRVKSAVETFEKIVLDANVVTVECGLNCTMAITDKGEVYSWGSGLNGAHGHGDDTDQYLPKLVEGVSSAISAAVGANLGLVLTSDGEVFMFGRNPAKGWKADIIKPTALEMPGNVSFVAAGKSQLALIVNGSLYTFGKAGKGGLGHRNNEDQVAPVEVTKLKGKTVTAVAAGWNHFALVADSTLYSFGESENGRLGFHL